MKTSLAVVLPPLLLALSSCREGAQGPAQGPTDSSVAQGVRIINAYTLPVDVLVDGALAASAVPPGQLDSIEQPAGAHTVGLRETGSTGTVAIPLRTVTGGLRTIAAIRAGGVLSATALDDSNAMVPAGATKVRVLHLAPNAGEIEVGRTQPDWLSPPLIGWKIPFLYDTLLSDPLANPYYQSTVGPWDVRAWRKPSEDVLGWDGTTARVTFTLASGEKRTVLVLDRPGGGIRLSVIE